MPVQRSLGVDTSTSRGKNRSFCIKLLELIKPCISPLIALTALRGPHRSNFFSMKPRHTVFEHCTPALERRQHRFPLHIYPDSSYGKIDGYRFD